MSNEEEKVVSLAQARGKDKKEKECNQQIDGETYAPLQPVYCSFCGRPNTMVVKMIEGPGVNICSECTMIAVQYLILNDRMLSAEAQQILDAFWGQAK